MNGTRSLFSLIGEKAYVSVQNPVVLGTDSAAEPDITILRNRDDNYAHGLPQPEDVILAIELADSSFSYDKNTKAPLYAEHGIPELWIIHRKKNEVIRVSDLKEGNYNSETKYSATDSLMIPELEIDVPLSCFLIDG